MAQLLKWLIFPVLACIAVPAWANNVLYSTSFENPPFTTGAIAGQNGWATYGPGILTVENSFADTGSQAVFVDGGATSQSGAYYADSSTGPLLDLSADIAIFASSTQSEWQFGALGPGLVGYLGGIDIYPNGEIQDITSATANIGTFNYATAFNSSAWVNVNLLFNMATQTYSITVGGVTLATDVPFCGGNGSCTGAPLTTMGSGFFDSFGNGNDSGYMDNYSLTQVSPEPGTAISVAGALLAGLLIKLRRK